MLEVKNLHVSLPNQGEQVEIIHGIDFHIEQGEMFGFVGESGSGKSMTALSLLGLLPNNAIVSAERMQFDGTDLLTQTQEQWQQLRGNQISIVFQEPMTSLNPVLTIENQVEEGLLLHGDAIYRTDKAARRNKVIEILKEAELPHPEQLLNAYPHQLSGGMRQRVMIAIAMLNRPKLLIADEPTTALDVATQEKVLALLSYYQKEYKTAVLFISHDLQLVHLLCDRIAVLKDGKVVEMGLTEKLFLHPQQEYTKQLLTSTKISLRTKTEHQCPVMTVTNASFEYVEKKIFKKDIKKKVLNHISFSLYEGEILGLVGNSGSGKSTLSKAITGLVSFSEGNLQFKQGYEHPQMVFQDPYGSLNPAKKIGWILEEPLKITKNYTQEERKQLVSKALLEVELTEDYANRYVRELSGGQRQRIAIACALICHPKIVILDEPVSALDVTVQDQILKLLCRLQKEHNISYLFISHDIEVIRRICDRVIILRDGTLSEQKEQS